MGPCFLSPHALDDVLEVVHGVWQSGERRRRRRPDEGGGVCFLSHKLFKCVRVEWTDAIDKDEALLSTATPFTALPRVVPGAPTAANTAAERTAATSARRGSIASHTSALRSFPRLSDRVTHYNLEGDFHATESLQVWS